VIGCALVLFLLPLRILASLLEMLARAMLRDSRRRRVPRGQPAAWAGPTGQLSPAWVILVLGVLGLLVVMGIGASVSSRTTSTPSISSTEVASRPASDPLTGTTLWVKGPGGKPMDCGPDTEHLPACVKAIAIVRAGSAGH
jgi:hypothetical protein